VAVSIGVKLPENGLVRPFNAAIECDLNGILKERRDCKRFWGCIRDGNECKDG
jgi:hypothetical protein